MYNYVWLLLLGICVCKRFSTLSMMIGNIAIMTERARARFVLVWTVSSWPFSRRQIHKIVWHGAPGHRSGNNQINRFVSISISMETWTLNNEKNWLDGEKHIATFCPREWCRDANNRLGVRGGKSVMLAISSVAYERRMKKDNLCFCFCASTSNYVEMIKCCAKCDGKCLEFPEK